MANAHDINHERAKRFREIVESASSGRAILFLGAGVHWAPPAGSPYQYPPNHRPPSGGELSEELANQTDFRTRFPQESPKNLQRVAAYYELVNDRKTLIDYVHQRVEHGKRPSAALRALAALPFQMVITTNYDSLFERAALMGNRQPQLIHYETGEEQRPREVQETADAPALLKLHGDVNLRDNVVITDEDYIHFVLRMADKVSPVPDSFRANLRRWPLVFIGYSLLDYNLRLLLRTLWYRMDRANQPQAFSVDPYPDYIISQVWGRPRGNIFFIDEGVWDFVPPLYKAVTGANMPP